ncbi:VOC family protein [Devosia sp. CN2-171]|uniref:VOC family protein n=1 Tax=Devosia sp. CN2-171 TaxID=3400909 RepID=UPI003BF83242
MPSLMLHHVSIPITNIDRSLAFYRDIFELQPLPRPNFPIGGAWLACGDRQVHLVEHADATFRNGDIDNNDIHFAFRTDDFDAVVAKLEAHGFSQTAPNDDPRRIMMKRTGAAGFAQLYVLDPDRNVVEVNAAAV